jgi:RND family efflux transporter MFP subunit
MKKLFIYTFLSLYLAFMTACAGGGHNHDTQAGAVISHEHEGEHDHTHEADPGHEAGTGDDHLHEHEALPEHTVIVAKKQPFSFVIRAGGTILPDSKDIITVTSKASGIVRLTDHFLFPGMKVRNGTPLFLISGDELTSDNTEVALMEAASDYERARSHFERAERLISEQLITMDHYMNSKNDFEKAEIRYNNLRTGFGANGSLVTAPADGYINQVYITEGSKVSAGEALLSVIVEHNLVLRADVSPAHAAILGDVANATFRMTYSEKMYRTEDFNGKKISHARSTGENHFFIPLFFRLDFTPELIPGTYAEIYLRGEPVTDCITVPNTAILEEFGKYFIYVEGEDHQFIKRHIEKGMTDGINTEVLKGLHEGETVVATGAYAVKTSQMSTSAPGTHKH